MSISDWSIQLKTRIIHGPGSVAQLPSLVRESRLRRWLVIMDPEVEPTAFGRRVRRSLAETHPTYFTSFATNPTFEMVEECAEQYRRSHARAIISVGGGSAIDIGKAVGTLATNSGRIASYADGRRIRRPLPLTVNVPTTCGTGAEASPFAVLLDTEQRKKRGIESPLFVPHAIIIDPRSLESLSRPLIAATAFDALAHVIESYTSRRATSLTRVSLTGCLVNFSAAYTHALDGDISGLQTMQDIALSARLLYPRTGLSIAHALSHPIGAYSGLHHGMAVALVLPSAIRYNTPAAEKAFAEVAVLLGAGHSSMSLVRTLESFIAESGIAAAFRTLDVLRMPVAIVAGESMHSSNIPSNPRPVTAGTASRILRAALRNIAHGTP